MQKKHLILAAACAAAMLLAGCAGGHTHTAADIWTADTEQHWQSCTECDKKMNKGTHTLDDAGICTVCGAEVIDWGGSKSVYQFTAQGDLLRMADYDASGKLVAETAYENEYDESGRLLYTAVLVDGVVANETFYTVINGESVISDYIDYMEDGSKSVAYYDENGNAVQSILYDSDGNVAVQTDSEYALSASGEWYEAVSTVAEPDGGKYVNEFAENGDQISSTRYDADGSLVSRDIWEYTYNADGSWQTRKQYSNDVLTGEIVYATVTTADGSVTYPETVTQYYDDGTKTVTVYDENDQVLSETHYDVGGKVVS